MPSLHLCLILRTVILGILSLLTWKSGIGNGTNLHHSGGNRDLILHLDYQKSMGTDRIHQRVLKDLVDMITKLLSTAYQHSCSTGSVLDD